MVSLRRAVFSGGSWVAASTGILALVQLLQLVLLARILAPDDFGIVALLMMVQGFVEMLMTAGISNAIIQRQDADADELSSLHWLNTLIGLVLGVLIAASSPALSAFFNAPDAAIPIALLGLAVPINAQSHVSRACLERDLRFRVVAFAETIAGVTTVVAVIVGSAISGIDGVAGGMVIGFAVRSALFIRAARRDFRIRFFFKFALTRRFLDFGIFQLLNSLVGFVDGNTATVLIGHGLSPSSLGGYNLAYNTSVNVPGKLNPIVTRVMFPALARMQHDSKRFSDAVLTLIGVTGMVNTPLMLSLGITAPLAVPLVFGEKWAWAAGLVQILAVCGFIRGLANPMGVVLMARDRQRLGLIINLGKTAVSIVLMILAIRFWEVTGAALALVASGCLTLLINQFLLRHLLDCGSRRILWAHVMPLAAAVPSAALGGVLMVLTAEAWSAALVVIAVAAVVVGAYFGTLVVMQVPIAVQLVRALRTRIGRGGAAGEPT
ncbi:MOP flippase family protein [Microbacterium arabinogalactanolyticum]|uniref:MOP flippase family protein n=1 Tax=Microbacterium arabinogalactanolyticum TaxID=69365 RepID=UPI0040445009